MEARPRAVIPRFIAVLLLFFAGASAHACGDTLAGAHKSVENSDYTVVYTTAPNPVEVGRHFTIDFAVCARGKAAAPREVRLDASMPVHRHGMNYRPTVTTLRPGVYRGEGLLFHMPGRWDLAFDVVGGNGTQRLTSTLHVD
jgi:hypothetical protein